MITTFTHPKSCRFSETFELAVDGQLVEVLSTDTADFATFIYDASQGAAEVVVKVAGRILPSAALRPVAKGLTATVEADEARFTISEPVKLSIEIPGLKPLYFWANAPETNAPDPDDPTVHYFEAGQTYEVGQIGIEAGETLYIEGGAVVKGRLLIRHADDIRIAGHGIFDGSYYSKERRGERVPSILIERCKNVLVEDIIMIHPSGWMLVPGACKDVEIRNLKQIGEVVSSDGIDIVGSKRVRIHDCFLSNNDDCVVIKAFHLKEKNLTHTNADLRECPEDILVENCTLLNQPAGNAMEIGHELAVDYVRDVTFRDIDVLSVHGQGAVFSLHNNDHATIENILFEDIRIEHCWDKFIDFRISKSRYSTDDERGQIRNVRLKNIEWTRPPWNEGYTISLIGGWDTGHTIEDIAFEDVRINGTPIEHVDELEINTRYASNIRVVGSPSF